MYTMNSLWCCLSTEDTDQDYHVAVFDVGDLRYNYTTDYEIKLVFVCGVVVYEELHPISRRDREEIFSAFENSEYPWDAQDTLLLLLCLLNVSQFLFSVTQSSFKNTTQRSAPRGRVMNGRQGVKESMENCLGQWSPPMFWSFSPEQVQDPDKLVK